MSMKLRDYQEDCLAAIRNALDKGITRQLIVIPTGGGKTYLFSHIPSHVLEGPMLVLAHREELLQQAKNTVLSIQPNANVSIEQGENFADETSDVVIASVPTLGRDGSDRIERFDKNYFKTIVIDEAHHSTASTYARILDYFEPELQIGVTATPQRSDKQRLLDVFDEIVYFRTIQDMIKEGYLVDMRGYRIPTDVDISSVTTRSGDYAIGELSEAINTDSRNKIAVEAYKDIANDKKTITFCADVAHAYSMDKAFRDAGIASAVVVGTTPKDERKEIFQEFAEGNIKVLHNVGVATEGFDEPSIECVLFARPTKSAVLYTQSLGRGLRLHPGKENCIVIDLADATKGKKPVGLPTLMGLPPDFDSEGEELTEVAQKFVELEEKSPEEAARVRSVKDIKEAWEHIDLFTPPPVNEELLEYTEFIWMETSNDKYVLNVAPNEKLTITGDALGRYAVDLHMRGKSYRLGGEGYVCKSMGEAFSRTDKWVKKNRNDKLNLLDARAQWRAGEPTEKQLKFLQRKNLPVTKDLTRGQASRMIDEYIKRNPKPEKPAWLQRKIEAQRKGW